MPVPPKPCRNRLTDVKDRFTLAKGEGGGEGMGWEADIANANGYIQNG